MSLTCSNLVLSDKLGLCALFASFMSAENSLDCYPVNRFAENLRFLNSISYVNSIAYVNTDNVIELSESLCALNFCDSVLIWLDAIDIDDKTAIRLGAFAAFSWFHTNDDVYVCECFPYKRTIQVQDDVYRYVSLSLHPITQRAAKENLLC